MMLLLSCVPVTYKDLIKYINILGMIKFNIFILGLIFIAIIIAIYLYKKWIEFEELETFTEEGLEEALDDAIIEGFEDAEIIEGFAKKRKGKWRRRIWKGIKFARYLTPAGLATKGLKKLGKRALRSKYGQRLKKKLSEKAKEKAKEKIIAYLQKKVEQHPKIKPVIDMIKNNEWVPAVAQKIRENPMLITGFSLLATNAALREYAQNANATVPAELKEMKDPRLQQAITTLQADPQLRERIKQLMQYPVVKEVADELASDNGIVRKTKNVIRIIKDWLRSLRKPGETSVDEDDITADNLDEIGGAYDEFLAEKEIKTPLPQISHDDFEGYTNYSSNWGLQFGSINPNHAWDVNR